MNQPDFFIEIFLQPGDFYWGDKDTRIRTLLGSCISVSFWHPQKLEGGMCHFMLPSRPNTGDGGLNGKYADEAFLMFFSEMNKNGTRPDEYEIKMFGGSNMFSGLPQKQEGIIGERNIQAARELLDRYHLKLSSQDVGSTLHRRIYFDLWDGSVWVKKAKTPINENIL